ncbi:hypothetical protein C7M61_005250 [Candidozyma pseudohaemuli]|uniref:Uncharacterized protein n=1 Tax=Candidozyma pseudohaemuli TaxID=418784 RepID=A0A2P7YCN3_9ASCO|nr:hypothetical protein C7M61_005250 [[Candida] pseudohaemulonii]PSK33697.1 hypothetical protein C7M61_005250 [[Candida] pseudohaemulonii]
MSDFESMLVLSPCLLTSTVVPGKTLPYGETTTRELPTPNQLKVMLPNLVETKNVDYASLEAFVSRYLGDDIVPTMLHFLVYLYAQNWNHDMGAVSDIKLLHMGKQYRLTRLMDIHNDHPTVLSVASRFPNFQLFVTPDQVLPPVTLPVEELMARSQASKTPEEEIPVTYADAMMRMIRRALHRKLSVALAGSGSTVSRTSLSSSENSRKRSKLKQSWRKVVNCVTVSAR